MVSIGKDDPPFTGSRAGVENEPYVAFVQVYRASGHVKNAPIL